MHYFPPHLEITTYLHHYPRGRFGGRQPLCGIGVTSLIEVTSNPAACKALTAASRPGPGPLTQTSTVFHTTDP